MIYGSLRVDGLLLLVYLLRDVLFWYNVKINGLRYQTKAFGNRRYKEPGRTPSTAEP